MRQINISIQEYGACLCEVSARFVIGQGGKTKLKRTHQHLVELVLSRSRPSIVNCCY